MKMAKKLLALVLTGVMAMSVLTGCGSASSRQAAGKLEGMLKKANSEATVEDGGKALADTVIGAVAENGKIKTENKNDEIRAVKAVLPADNNDTYVWYTYFKAEGKNKTDKAQAIADGMLKEGTDGTVKIDDYKAVNGFSLTNTKKYKPGNAFVLSMNEFTVKETNGSETTDVVYIMAVVTCKRAE